MTRRLVWGLWCGASAAALAIAPASAAAQQQSAATAMTGTTVLSRDDIMALARIQVAITVAHDSSNARRAKSGNKTAKAQAQLQDSLRSQIADILHHGGLTDAEYQRRTYLVSSDSATRRVFDSVVVALTGAPLPGGILRGMTVPVPPGPAGMHIGHVVNEFRDTPQTQGLLPTALGEARVAAQHAQLATRQPTNLEYMKTHAGPVIHALDPTIVTMGPGLGYGLKKSANLVANHIELAALSQGASQQVVMHSKHVATAARSAAARADQLLALAQKVLAATSAADAAAIVSQMASLADQLMAGVDANGDGRITWEQGEGGLQQVDEHVKLMLKP
ncbi:MAG TPA: hypothetical protein VFT29_20030 [Gemmatimonadaceae bacterium]|nr:hypothetical protein [Gemmatimonadaceae bacterium]